MGVLASCMTRGYGGSTGGGRAEVRCWYGVTLGWHRGSYREAVWQWWRGSEGREE